MKDNGYPSTSATYINIQSHARMFSGSMGMPLDWGSAEHYKHDKPTHFYLASLTDSRYMFEKSPVLYNHPSGLVKYIIFHIIYIYICITNYIHMFF